MGSGVRDCPHVLDWVGIGWGAAMWGRVGLEGGRGSQGRLVENEVMRQRCIMVA